MTQAPLLKTLEGALKELQIIPLWGTPPPFPWEQFSKEIASTLEQKEVSVQADKTEWLSGESLTKGMGDVVIKSFTLSPLHGTFFWVMLKESYVSLINMLLTKENEDVKISDPSLQEGFYHFLCLNILQTFNQLNLYGDLVGSLTEETKLPEEGALSIDLSIQVNQLPFGGRLICSKEAHASFKAHFQMTTPPLLSDPQLASLPLPLSLEIGSTVLSASQWKEAEVGDFILLDRCTYDLINHRGNAVLNVGNTPLFDIRIKKEEVKILEYALFQEERSMSEIPPSNEDFEETPPSEETPEMETNEESPLWSTTNGEENNEELLSTRNIPLTLIVEVGKIQMPLDKVTQLKPGNVLDLSVNPQLGVHLTIGGKRVAKGELVQLGEALGVKILNLGE